MGIQTPCNRLSYYMLFTSTLSDSLYCSLALSVSRSFTDSSLCLTEHSSTIYQSIASVTHEKLGPRYRQAWPKWNRVRGDGRLTASERPRDRGLVSGSISIFAPYFKINALTYTRVSSTIPERFMGLFGLHIALQPYVGIIMKPVRK